jgi:hypothetical protein
MYCSKCGAQLMVDAQFCQRCGSPVAPPGSHGGSETPGAVSGAGNRFSHLPAYWQAVFQDFEKRPTVMQTHWDWPAFFFGAFWYLVKGMPAKGALYFVLVILTWGVGWLFLAVYAGLYGAWDYYLKEARGKQLW